MLITTQHHLADHEIEKTLGIVRGNAVHARSAGFDLVASIRIFIGGKVTEYEELMETARESAFAKMIDQAKSVNADAVVGMQFTTSMIVEGTSEVMAYGTAVTLKK